MSQQWTHVTMIPSELINDEGVLKISIYNLFEAPPNFAGMGDDAI